VCSPLAPATLGVRQWAPLGFTLAIGEAQGYSLLKTTSSIFSTDLGSCMCQTILARRLHLVMAATLFFLFLTFSFAFFKEKKKRKENKLRSQYVTVAGCVVAQVDSPIRMSKVHGGSS
jgi:membrane protein implicated in regulation of membrane protease activity